MVFPALSRFAPVYNNF